MSRTAFTLRIEAEERNALKTLSKIEGRPINQLLIEAIQIYLGQQGRRERALEANLKNLRDYRKKDPGFKRAMSAFVDMLLLLAVMAVLVAQTFFPPR